MGYVDNSSTNYLVSEEYIRKTILPFYGLDNSIVNMVKFKNTDKARVVYRVTQKDKSYCLKKVYYTSEDLLYNYSAIEWLSRNNINVPKFLPTINNNRFVANNNMLFVLSPWIEGNKCSFDNIMHVQNSIKNLANIHKVSINFFPIDGSSKKHGFDDFYISNRKHYYDLLQSSNNAFKYKDKFSKQFLSCFNYSIKLAEISLYMSSKIDQKLLSKSLCHGDYVNKNIIFSSPSEVWTIDFDKCKNDYCAKDLSYFMRRILKRENTKWNTGLAMFILDNYQNIKKLSQSDLYYIISYISFPQKYWKISRDYYRNINRCNRSSFQILLSDAIYKTENQYEFILQFINEIQKFYGISLI